MRKPEYQIVIMTASSRDEAERIATVLVEEGLAACVNVVPQCRSVYKWKDEIVKDDEAMMLAKTRRDRFEDVVRRVTALHSYEVPEIIAVSLESFAESYGRFLGDVLGG
jgi:periplasmic divalent cation tolerance protein